MRDDETTRTSAHVVVESPSRTQCSEPVVCVSYTSIRTHGTAVVRSRAFPRRRRAGTRPTRSSASLDEARRSIDGRSREHIRRRHRCATTDARSIRWRARTRRRCAKRREGIIAPRASWFIRARARRTASWGGFEAVIRERVVVVVVERARERADASEVEDEDARCATALLDTFVKHRRRLFSTRARAATGEARVGRVRCVKARAYRVDGVDAREMFDRLTEPLRGVLFP